MELAKHNICFLLQNSSWTTRYKFGLFKPQKVFMAQSLRQITAHVILFARLRNWRVHCAALQLDAGRGDASRLGLFSAVLTDLPAVNPL